jgi:hypothetical protein
VENSDTIEFIGEKGRDLEGAVSARVVGDCDLPRLLEVLAQVGVKGAHAAFK